jgi:hypothetical protein
MHLAQDRGQWWASVLALLVQSGYLATLFEL